MYVKTCRSHARLFINYVHERGMSLATVGPADVTAYFNVAFANLPRAEAESSE
jgi:hypothetical protein